MAAERQRQPWVRQAEVMCQWSPIAALRSSPELHCCDRCDLQRKQRSPLKTHLRPGRQTHTARPGF